MSPMCQASHDPKNTKVSQNPYWKSSMSDDGGRWVPQAPISKPTAVSFQDLPGPLLALMDTGRAQAPGPEGASLPGTP